MRLVDKLKLFEKQLVFMKWGTSEGYGKLNYVGMDFVEFEIFDTDELEYTDKLLINAQLILEVVIRGSDIARISTASSAAFAAPFMATVATGIPEGIITVESRASIPSKTVERQGMPITGRVVLAATAPARCAAIPAAAIITPKPASRAPFEKSRTLSGARCAE